MQLQAGVDIIHGRTRFIKLESDTFSEERLLTLIHKVMALEKGRIIVECENQQLIYDMELNTDERESE